MMAFFNVLFRCWHREVYQLIHQDGQGHYQICKSCKGRVPYRRIAWERGARAEAAKAQERPVRTALELWAEAGTEANAHAEGSQGSDGQPQAGGCI